jgi:hypothetical protein
MLPKVVSLRVLARLVLAVSIGGLLPPSLPHLASAAAAGDGRVAATGRGHVDMPALPRAHAREGSRVDGARKAPHGSAAIPPDTGSPVPVMAGSGTRTARAFHPLSVARSATRLRGPPSRI